MDAVLEIRGLAKRFGGITVANGIDLDLRRGEIVGLLGPIGAGKTALFKLISGFIRQDSGEIRLKGSSIEQMPMHLRARAGLSRTWQNVRVFPSLTVLDNLLVAPREYGGESFLRVAFDQAAIRREREKITEMASQQHAIVRHVEAANR